MLLLDTLNEYNVNIISDGCGGEQRTYNLNKNIECRISKNINPAIKQQFGLTNEIVLHIISLEPLNLMKVYGYDEIKFSVRAQTANNRYYYTTLIQIL